MAVCAMIIFSEIIFYSARPNILKDFWNKFLINESKLIDHKKDFDFLVMGNSIQKTGILPKEVGESVLNLGLPGGRPIGHYFLLKRYLKQHKPPKTVFLSVFFERYDDSFHLVLKYFLNSPEVISIWSELTDQERETYLLKFFPTLDHRKVHLDVRDTYHGSNKSFVDQMIAHRGYMPSPQSSQRLEEGEFEKHPERVQSKIALDARDRRYLEKFIDLAEKNGIRIVMLGMVLPKELYTLLQDTGFIAERMAFLEDLKTRHPKLELDPRQEVFLENKYFGDRMHLNEEGSHIYTEYFKTALFEKYAGPQSE